jgi:FAD:protein FMN transferase
MLSVAIPKITALLVAASPPMFEAKAAVMGTQLHVRIVLEGEEQRPSAREAMTKVVDEFERLEQLFSEWKPNTPFGRLNAKPRTEIVLGPEAFALVQRSLRWSTMSHGAFDPTFASIWGLWRFDPEDADRIPTQSHAKKMASLIDYRQVLVNQKSKSVRLGRRKMKLGLGGIAKGYAVDQAKRLLRQQGFSDFFIKAGGELYVSGMRGQRPWIVGIQDPRNPSHYFATLALSNSACTTSGDYERFLIKDGVRYHHIIDPKTGYPARKSKSATIVAPRAEDADALSTAVFVMGHKKGMALIETLPKTEAVVVTSTGAVIVSSGLRGKLLFESISSSAGP